MQALLTNKFFIYLARFIGTYCIFYYGYVVLYGLTIPTGYYSPFLAEDFPFFNWFSKILLFITQAVVTLSGFQTYFEGDTILRIKGGSSIYVAPPCMGFAVLSFWIAFVFANTGDLKRKASWITGGCFAIILINVARISLVLLTSNAKSTMPLGLSHHTFFNILSYSCVFLMIYLYDRSGKKKRSAHLQKKNIGER